MEFNLEEIDELTPFYKNKLQQELSIQERKVLSAISREVEDRSISVEQVSKSARIFQTNHTHAILGRLVKKGFLKKQAKSTYAFIDRKLVAHLLVRASGICREKITA